MTQTYSGSAITPDQEDRFFGELAKEYRIYITQEVQKMDRVILSTKESTREPTQYFVDRVHALILMDERFIEEVLHSPNPWLDQQSPAQYLANLGSADEVFHFLMSALQHNLSLVFEWAVNEVKEQTAVLELLMDLALECAQWISNANHNDSSGTSGKSTLARWGNGKASLSKYHDREAIIISVFSTLEQVCFDNMPQRLAEILELLKHGSSVMNYGMSILEKYPEQAQRLLSGVRCDGEKTGGGNDECNDGIGCDINGSDDNCRGNTG